MLSSAPSAGLKRRSSIALCFALLFVWLVSFCFPETLATLEERSSDTIWRRLADARTERRIIVVDIDEASLARLGPWPWPRGRIEKISQRLAEEGAALQVFDIFLPTAKEGDSSLAATLAKGLPDTSSSAAAASGALRQQPAPAQPATHAATRLCAAARRKRPLACAPKRLLRGPGHHRHRERRHRAPDPATEKAPPAAARAGLVKRTLLAPQARPSMPHQPQSMALLVWPQPVSMRLRFASNLFSPPIKHA